MNSSYLSLFVALIAGMAIVFASPSAQGLPGDLRAEVVVDDLNFPVKMAALGDGDLLVNEKMGQVRLIRDGQLLSSPVARFDVKAQNEAGLLDVVIMPDFNESGEFLVSYTPEDALESIYVSRLRLEDDQATILDDPWIELPSLAGTDRHFAGTMSFDAAGDYLYVSIGDLRQREYSQNPDSRPGSVLRYNADATVPDDNPFGADNAVYAYGLRNPFGTFVDVDGHVFVVENSGDVNDELNFIEAGLNYGWPLVEGYCDNFPVYEPCADQDSFEDPIFAFRTVIGPTSVIRYEGDMITEFDGDLMVSGWHSGKIHHIEWGGPGERAVEKGTLFEAPTSGAGFTDIIVDDDGSLLVLESSASSGAIYRIAPRDQIRDSDSVVGNENNSSGCSQVRGGGESIWWVLIVAVLLGIRRVGRRGNQNISRERS